MRMMIFFLKKFKRNADFHGAERNIVGKRDGGFFMREEEYTGNRDGVSGREELNHGHRRERERGGNQAKRVLNSLQFILISNEREKETWVSGRHTITLQLKISCIFFLKK